MTRVPRWRCCSAVSWKVATLPTATGWSGCASATRRPRLARLPVSAAQIGHAPTLRRGRRHISEKNASTPSLCVLTHKPSGWRTGNEPPRATYLAECFTRKETPLTAPPHHSKNLTNAFECRQSSQLLACNNGEGLARNLMNANTHEPEHIAQALPSPEVTESRATPRALR